MEKPTMKQRLDGLGKFIWNSEEGQILGRGGRSWAEIGVFYLIYYACLASFFAATLAVFYETVSDTEPKLQSDSSLLDGNPGLGFRPKVDYDDPKMKVNPEVGKNKDMKKNLDEFLDTYKKRLDTTGCSDHNKPRPGEKEACAVDLDGVSEHCKPEDDYGFGVGQPCVLIKLNKVFGWIPKTYKDENEAGFSPEWNMTTGDHIIPLRCYAKDKGDNLKLGTLKYYPQQGFPVHYFPYENQKDYRSPFVFVKFDEAERGVTYDMECRAYAKNIEYDRTDVQGSTQFKIYIGK